MVYTTSLIFIRIYLYTFLSIYLRPEIQVFLYVFFVRLELMYLNTSETVDVGRKEIHKLFQIILEKPLTTVQF